MENNNEITIISGDRELTAVARYDEETSQWWASISENGWEWEEGDTGPDYFPTADEALAWARRMIEETVADDVARKDFEARLAVYSVDDARALLGNITRQRLRIVARARGVGKRISGVWVFSQADIAAMRDRKRGRPLGYSPKRTTSDTNDPKSVGKDS